MTRGSRRQRCGTAPRSSPRTQTSARSWTSTSSASDPRHRGTQRSSLRSRQSCALARFGPQGCRDVRRVDDSRPDHSSLVRVPEPRTASLRGPSGRQRARTPPPNVQASRTVLSAAETCVDTRRELHRIPVRSLRSHRRRGFSHAHTLVPEPIPQATAPGHRSHTEPGGGRRRRSTFHPVNPRAPPDRRLRDASPHQAYVQRQAHGEAVGGVRRRRQTRSSKAGGPREGSPRESSRTQEGQGQAQGQGQGRGQRRSRHIGDRHFAHIHDGPRR
jgi:hypothetical protein